MANQRIFIGCYPEGIVYADRTVEVDGDYARLAFLPYSTLELEFSGTCPIELKQEILDSAARIQARRASLSGSLPAAKPWSLADCILDDFLLLVTTMKERTRIRLSLPALAAGFQWSRKSRDAVHLYCRECSSVIADVNDPFWSMSKTKAMHERGTQHLTLYICRA